MGFPLKTVGETTLVDMPRTPPEELKEVERPKITPEG